MSIVERLFELCI